MPMAQLLVRTTLAVACLVSTVLPAQPVPVGGLCTVDADALGFTPANGSSHPRASYALTQVSIAIPAPTSLRRSARGLSISRN